MKKQSLFVASCVFSAALLLVIVHSAFNARAAELVSTSLHSSSNLKAYYQLQSNGTDHQGNYNLTLYNSPSFGAAKYGNGMNLGSANTNKYAEVSDNMGIATGAITISLWMKLNSEPNSDWGWGVAGLGNASTNNEYWIDYLYNGGTRQVRFRRSNQMVNQAVQDYAISLGTSAWHHLVLTYDGTTLYGYVDNNKTAGVSASGSGTSSVLNHFTVGAHNENGIDGTSYASAIFDDVAVFNRALTDAEILGLYTKTSAHRTTDKTITSSATVQSDEELTLVLSGEKTYAVEGTVFAKSTNAAPGIKFGFTAPANSSLAMGYMALTDGLQAGGALNESGATAIVPATAGATIPIHISGTVTMSQLGNVSFQWAQSVSDDDGMKVLTGSYLKATEIE